VAFTECRVVECVEKEGIDPEAKAVEFATRATLAGAAEIGRGELAETMAAVTTEREGSSVFEGAGRSFVTVLSSGITVRTTPAINATDASNPKPRKKIRFIVSGRDLEKKKAGTERTRCQLLYFSSC